MKIPRWLVIAVIFVSGSAIVHFLQARDIKSARSADVSFAQMMIPHHQQAVEMADMVLDPTHQASAELETLATQMKSAQGSEIAIMKSMLQEWGEPTSMMGHDHMMDGMLSDAELTDLDQLQGVAFDRAWARAMIAHHRGAIAMAQSIELSVRNGQFHDLAVSMISAQRAEIKVLQRIAK